MTKTGLKSLVIVSSDKDADRIDRYLIKQGVSLTRSRIQRLISEQQICLNGAPVRASYKVRKGDRIDIYVPPPMSLDLIPEAIPLDILFEDKTLLVLNKAAGMVVHPSPGHYEGTMVHALLHHCQDLAGIGGRERPGIIHRLDKDTSGVMVVAKTDEAHRDLSRQFKDHSIERTYLAIVCGRVKKGGKISLAIGRDRINRKKISSRTAHPREAETHYSVKERFKTATLLEVSPQTGRTHQIRVHMASLDYPIIGDKDYGGKSKKLLDIHADRQMLHAAKLGFIHPGLKKQLSFATPVPSDMEAVLEQLRGDKGRLLSNRRP